MSSSEEEEFNGDLEDEEDINKDDDDDDVADDNEGVDDGEGDANDDDESADEPLSSLASSSRKKRSASQSVSYTEDGDSDDSEDDDVPLASLGKNGSGKIGQSSTKKKSPAKKKPSPSKKKSPDPPSKKKKSNGSSSATTATITTASTTSSKSKNYDSLSSAFYGSECDKGLLIQRLLCRWWYAYTWPDPSVLPKKPPVGYDSLDGFPGVYVCTGSSSKIGQIMDVRNHDECPSFQTFSKKSSAELKELLLKALRQQKEELIASEGPGSKTEKEIDSLISWTNRVNAEKAEREVAKVLKANKLKM